MKKYLVSFANDIFYKNQKRLEVSALKFGVDEVVSYTDTILRKTDFYKKNKEILKQKRGAGYWLWKPYIILDLMEKINDGDLVVYSDSGIEIIDNLNPLFEICQKQNGILLFNCGGHLNKTWTKRDCFVLMNCDEEKYWNGEQTLGSFQVYIKNEKSVKFLKEYLEYGKNKNIITDIPNVTNLPNFPEFKDHRHDQSILSLLTIKYNIELFRDPSQWGNYLKLPNFRKEKEFLSREYAQSPMLNSPYSTLINHHREREIKKINNILNKIKNLSSKILRYAKKRLIKQKIQTISSEPMMEITTVIGCKVNCKYCPQDKLIKAYTQKSNIHKMSLDTFQKCLDKMPPETQIHFSGMAEPWLNSECSKMILYAHNRGHKIVVYTTLAGMTLTDIDSIKNIPFRIFKVHLPDLEKNSHITVDNNYLNILNKISHSNIQNLSYMNMGTLPPEVQKIVNAPIAKPKFNSRAGNLTDNSELINNQAKHGIIRCEAGGNKLNHNILLPNGDVLLCCMDYGMQHILGNLLSNDYDSLFCGDEYKKIKQGLFDESIDILCRKCYLAKKY